MSYVTKAIHLRSHEILQIICHWEALAFRSSKEVLHDWVCVVAKRHFDWSVKAMNVSVVAGSLYSCQFSIVSGILAMHRT